MRRAAASASGACATPETAISNCLRRRVRKTGQRTVGCIVLVIDIRRWTRATLSRRSSGQNPMILETTSKQLGCPILRFAMLDGNINNKNTSSGNFLLSSNCVVNCRVSAALAIWLLSVLV